MESYIYIPRSLSAAGKHLRHAFVNRPSTLPKKEFLRAWSSISYLYPGLHPDGFKDDDGGWPRALKSIAAEAWKRALEGEITDNELYCYQACKARITRERKKLERSEPWLLSDHFAV